MRATRRDRIRWARRAAAAASVVGLVVHGPTASAATEGPTMELESSCSTGAPYAVSAHISRFPPNATFWIIAPVWFTSGAFQVVRSPFTTDESGAVVIGSLEATEPFDGFAILYRNGDSDRRLGPADDIITEVTFTVDEPCQAGLVQPK